MHDTELSIRPARILNRFTRPCKKRIVSHRSRFDDIPYKRFILATNLRNTKLPYSILEERLKYGMSILCLS
ncbi:hypothetical protein LEP1GSC050_1195 [Leptospira broomii serovar Hurstbridge str. 5399]|uniref:Uncharacterized protein n=1 Tax=Leptospira broomii serovar Hurstbridge str. 5399 TaxID=1049789 RepID=T0F823_9LEPT|nr:hypothetical protein LEP1GSC050_1195 [Leptospira broomii serovar Hurstbridge str. 5399]